MYLYELFTTHSEPVYQTMGPMTMGMFEINDQPYALQFIHTKQGDMLQKYLKNAPITPNTYFFSFAAINEYGMPVDDRYEVESSIPVFGAVLNAVIEFCKKHNIDTLYFGGEAKDLKRLKLYSRIMQRYIRQYNWKLVGEEEAMVQGRLQHLYYVQRNV